MADISSVNAGGTEYGFKDTEARKIASTTQVGRVKPDGTTITIDNDGTISVEETLRDAEVIEGKNLLDVTGKSRDIITVNSNNSITFNGSTTGVAKVFSFVNDPKLSSLRGTYVFSAGVNVGSDIWLTLTTNSGVIDLHDAESITVTLTDSVYLTGEVHSFMSDGVTFSNFTVYPMLCTKEEWDKSHEYKPYYEPLKDRTLDIADQQTLGAYNLLKNNATTQTLNGVAYTVNADGTVSTNNTASANSTLYIQKSNDSTFALDYALVAGRRAYLSGCPTGGAADKYFIDVYIDNGGGDEHWYRDTGEGAVIDFPAVKPAFIFVYITVRSGQNMTGKVFKPMIALQPNMPYVKWVMTNEELTDKVAVKTGTVMSANQDVTVNFSSIIKKAGIVTMTVTFTVANALSSGVRPLSFSDVFRPMMNSFCPLLLGSSPFSFLPNNSAYLGPNYSLIEIEGALAAGKYILAITYVGNDL